MRFRGKFGALPVNRLLPIATDKPVDRGRPIGVLRNRRAVNRELYVFEFPRPRQTMAGHASPVLPRRLEPTVIEGSDKHISRRLHSRSRRSRPHRRGTKGIR
jgi:hypothetical protein